MNLITCEIESRKLVFVCIQIIVVLKIKKHQCDIQTKEYIYRLLVEFQMRVQHSRQSDGAPCSTRINLKGYFSLFAIFLNRSQLTYISSSS